MAAFVLTSAVLATLVSPTAIHRRAHGRAVSALRQQGARLEFEVSFPSWLSFAFGHANPAGDNVWRASLDGTKADDTALVWLGALVEVRDVRIHSALITDEGFKHVKRLSRLESLEVWYAPISDAGVESLRELKHLKSLSLTATKVTDAGLANLAERAPACPALYG